MSEFRVLTTKEQASITSLLEKANAALLAINELLALEPAPVKKTRKPRKAKLPDNVAEAAPKAKRGRPAKVATVAASDPGV